MDRVNFSAKGNFQRQNFAGTEKGGFEKQKRGRPCDLPRFSLKGKTPVLEIDSNREGFFLSVLGIILVFVAAFATRAGVSKNGGDREGSDERSEK